MAVGAMGGGRVGRGDWRGITCGERVGGGDWGAALVGGRVGVREWGVGGWMATGGRVD